jgi:hypothetical protein
MWEAIDADDGRTTAQAPVAVAGADLTCGLTTVYCWGEPEENGPFATTQSQRTKGDSWEYLLSSTVRICSSDSLLPVTGLTVSTMQIRFLVPLASSGSH